MRHVTVNASKEYSVYIGSDLLPQSGKRIMEACGGAAAALVTDDKVDRLYGDIVEKSLRSAGYATVRYKFPNGERSKNTETYISLLCKLTQADLTRSDVVVALGGGVTGDLAGFAAATYLRGVRFVQIPTTLLAMVDSSVGGKTAVNLPAGKNQVGAFYQPDLVICDHDTLGTLPEEVFRDGCAEMVKHGIILSAELLELLKKPLRPNIEDIIAKNIIIKRDVVIADERDTGIRQLLNFGHTIAHGIEKHSNYKTTHGSAVAAGMAIAARGAWRMGFCDKICYTEIVDILKRFGLPYSTDIPAELLMNAAFSDKKRSGSHITEVIPEEIGKCRLHSFDMNELEEFINLGIKF